MDMSTKCTWQHGEQKLEITQCQSTSKWISKLWYIHKIKLHNKKKCTTICTITWVSEYQSLILNERSQT